MRTLELNEIEEVSGGFVQVLPLVKYVIGAALAGGVILSKQTTEQDAIKKAADLCLKGSDATATTKTATLSCTASKAQPAPSAPSGHTPDQLGGMLKIQMPYGGAL